MAINLILIPSKLFDFQKMQIYGGVFTMQLY